MTSQRHVALARQLVDYRDPPSSQPGTTYRSASVPEASRDNLSVHPGALYCKENILKPITYHYVSDRTPTSKRAILITLIKGMLKGSVQYLNVLLIDAKLHLDTDLKRKRLTCCLEKT